LGVVRAAADPDNCDAEFGIIIRPERKGAGLGPPLMRKLIAFQRDRGTQRLVATVVCENRHMLDLAKELGFQCDAEQPEADIWSIQLSLAAAASSALAQPQPHHGGHHQQAAADL